MSARPLAALGGGTGRPVLLLHGLGATAAVWQGVGDALAHEHGVRWVAPDLPGHGLSAPLPAYSSAALADAVAAWLPEVVTPDEPLVVVGHSLGGVVGLALAGPAYAGGVAATVALGVKVRWSAQELDRAAALAARPRALLATPTEAVERALRLAGLTGLADPASDAALRGVQERDGGWQPALDPAAFAVGAPDLPALLAGARGDVLLARGEADPMVSEDHLRALAPEPVTLPGLGHNAHVEDPAAVAALVARLL